MCANDIKEVAEIHMGAFQERSMGALLSKEYILAKSKWFVSNDNAISLVAHYDNQVIGFIYGAPVGYENLMHRKLFLTILKIVFFRPSFILNRKLISKLINKISKLKYDNENSVNMQYYPKPIIKIADVAVINSYKNQGIGSMLINTFEKEAFKRNFKCIILKTKRSNKAAIKMYKRNDWVNIDDTSSKEMTYFIKQL